MAHKQNCQRSAELDDETSTDLTSTVDSFKGILTGGHGQHRTTKLGFGGLPQGAPPPAPIITFCELYLSSAHDKRNGDFTTLRRNFDPLDTAITPATLRASVGDQDDRSTAALVMLEKKPHHTDGAGNHHAGLHSIWRYVRDLATSLQSDDHIFAFTGDVQDRNLPTTLELPADTFHPATPSSRQGAYGSHKLWPPCSAPTPPMLQVVDMPNPHNVGQGLSDVRYCAPIPFCYFQHYLRSLMPREAFEVVHTDIVTNGDLNWVLPFLCFLTFTCQRLCHPRREHPEGGKRR
jgi:hypothetical protein